MEAFDNLCIGRFTSREYLSYFYARQRLKARIYNLLVIFIYGKLSFYVCHIPWRGGGGGGCVVVMDGA